MSASATTCPLKFVTQPRPPFDFRLEHDGEKEEEAEIQKAWDELRKSVRAYDRKVCFLPQQKTTLSGLFDG